MMISVLWYSRYDELMMVKSMNCMARPKLKLNFLFSHATMMSVPPVEPLWLNTMPNPAPPRIPPISTCMKRSSPTVMTRWWAKNGCMTPIIRDSMVTPIIVRMVNCLLSALKPMRSSVMFSTQIEMAVGMSNA